MVAGYAQLLADGGGPGRGGGGGPSVLIEVAIGGALALLVLLVVYGSAIAVVPLLTAVPAIPVTFRCVLGFTTVTPISYFLQYLIACAGLRIALDYSLLIVVRWREERDRSLSNEDAIHAAANRAGAAVLLSGAAVAVGLLSLAVLPRAASAQHRHRRHAPVVAITAALTLLPHYPRRLGPSPGQAPNFPHRDPQPWVGAVGPDRRAAPPARRTRRPGIVLGADVEVILGQLRGRAFFVSGLVYDLETGLVEIVVPYQVVYARRSLIIILDCGVLTRPRRRQRRRGRSFRVHNDREYFLWRRTRSGARICS